MSDKHSGRIIKNDILLIGAVLIFAVLVFLVFLFSLKDGKYVTVSIDGVEKYRYSINENVETEIVTGNDSQNTNILVISDGKAYISQADCPDKICVEHRAISKTGETIVCLPHRVVVAVTDSDKSLDIVA